MSAPTLTNVLETSRRLLHLPDPIPTQVLLAATLANRMREGDPVWLVLVGGSSRGKTELLEALSSLEYTRPISSFTEAALLSGTPKKERTKNASGGLLRELPEHGGILIYKDFGAILAMQRDKRATALQALRDIYDGRYTRDVGTGGGEHLEWTGKVGLLAGATGELDRHHAVLSALGERWLTLRLGDASEREMALASVRRFNKGEIRRKLADVVVNHLGTIAQPELRPLDEKHEELLAALSVLTVRARSPVLRDSYGTREIELVPQGEGPGRFVGQLHKLLVALTDGLGLSEGEAEAILVRVAFDSIPSPRRETLELVAEQNGSSIETTTASLRLSLPRTTAERELQNLAALRLVKREKAGDKNNSPNAWAATADLLALYGYAQNRTDKRNDAPPICHPYMSLKETNDVDDDISGEQFASLDDYLEDLARTQAALEVERGQP